MKILYAGMKYDYGRPEWGLSFEHNNFYCTLKEMDYEVIYFDCLSVLKKEGRKKMNQQLLDIVYNEKPDLLFTIIMEDEFDPKVIKKISRETSTVTYNWFCDDHWRFDKFSKRWAPCFNWVSTTDQESISKYQKNGYTNVIKTQWGVNPFLYVKKDLPKIYDVTFVGQNHSNRKKLIKQLQNKGIQIECFGRGWHNGKVSQEEMINIFNQSKINLNLNNSSTNKWYRFWKKDREQIKGRNFEVPGTGGFLLTGVADNLQQYFNYQQEVGIYQSESELAEQILFYLQNNEERENIAQAGYNRSLKEHSYTKRFEEIFATIFR
jgi:spore maturation protein CgeB